MKHSAIEEGKMAGWTVVPDSTQDIIDRKKLEKIYKLNSEDKFKVNDNLMKMLSDEHLLFTAYKKLKENDGFMTPGTLNVNETVDNLKQIKKGKTRGFVRVMRHLEQKKNPGLKRLS